jgi:hypothetical protein
MGQNSSSLGSVRPLEPLSGDLQLPYSSFDDHKDGTRFSERSKHLSQFGLPEVNPLATVRWVGAGTSNILLKDGRQQDGRPDLSYLIGANLDASNLNPRAVAHYVQAMEERDRKVNASRDARQHEISSLHSQDNDESF